MIKNIINFIKIWMTGSLVFFSFIYFIVFDGKAITNDKDLWFACHIMVPFSLTIGAVLGWLACVGIIESFDNPPRPKSNGGE